MCKVYLGAEQMLIRPAFIFAFFFFGNYFLEERRWVPCEKGPRGPVVLARLSSGPALAAGPAI